MEEKNIEEFKKLPEDIRDLEKDIFKNSETREDNIKIKHKMFDEVFVSVSGETGDVGKLLFSNQQKRDTETHRRLKLKQEYNDVITEIDGLTSSIKEKSIQVGYKKRMFRLYESLSIGGR